MYKHWLVSTKKPITEKVVTEGSNKVSSYDEFILSKKGKFIPSRVLERVTLEKPTFIPPKGEVSNNNNSFDNTSKTGSAKDIQIIPGKVVETTYEPPKVSLIDKKDVYDLEGNKLVTTTFREYPEFSFEGTSKELKGSTQLSWFQKHDALVHCTDKDIQLDSPYSDPIDRLAHKLNYHYHAVEVLSSLPRQVADILRVRLPKIHKWSESTIKQFLSYYNPKTGKWKTTYQRPYWFEWDKIVLGGQTHSIGNLGKTFLIHAEDDSFSIGSDTDSGSF